MTRARSIVLFALAFMLALCLSGCAHTSAEGTVEAALSGGGANGAESANLREVSVEQQDNTTLVRLSFINGSRYADVEETKLSDVPEYGIEQLDSPPRLKVSLHTRFADYAQAGTVLSGSVVRALFDCAMTGTQLATDLYLQLASPVDVSTACEGSTLTLSLVPKEASGTLAWHVGLNAMDQYAAGTIPADLGFTPTLCEDLASTILISSPFSTQEEAQTFARAAREQLPASLPESSLYVFDLAPDALPPYQKIAESELAASLDVLEVDGAPTAVPVFLENGRYLCTASDGTVAYSVPYLPDASVDEEQVVKEEVWSLAPDGSRKLYGAGQFYDIAEAAFSADGRYLAIVDARAEGQILYVYDTLEGTLRNLGEEGFGNATASFVWDPQGAVLYAMSGTNGSMQLLRIDLSAQGDASGVSSVEERNGSDSSIALRDGRLYFADQADQTIYAVDVSTGQRTPMGSGIDLALSDDGAYMAVLSWARGAEAEEMTVNLGISDAKTGEVLGTVLENAQVSGFFFGADSDTLYVATQSYEGVSDEYPFALLRYTVSSGELALVGYSKTEGALPSRTPGQVYLIYHFSGENSRILMPVTYVYTSSDA